MAPMEELLRDLRHTLRVLRSNPLFGIDPISWTPSERWIRWDAWDQARRDDAPGGSSLRSSWPGPSGWS